MEYCNFKILADGISFERTSYAEIETRKMTALDFLLENFSLTDDEKSNLKKREQTKVGAYPLDEIPFVYRTQEFKLCRIRRIIEVSDYLLQVLKLAEKIATRIKDVWQNNDSEKYLRLLLEINADKDNLMFSRNCHKVKEAYTKLIQEIPKDFIPIKPTAGGQNKNCSTAVFLCLHDFLTALENEFFFFVTSDVFLNNPIGETIFVIPYSLYRRFNFEYSGLTATERFSFSVDNPAKYAEEKLEFYTEVQKELENILKEASKIKMALLQKADDCLIEKIICRFENTFSGQTYGRLTKIKRFIEDIGFREKLTLFFCELQLDSIDLLEFNKNFGKESNLLKSFDAKDACYFFHLLCKRYFPNEKIGLTEFARLANLYTDKESPRSILSRNKAEFEKGSYCFSSRNRQRYEEILER